MKLRVTGMLLVILVFAAVLVPAFAAAVDQSDPVGEVGETTEAPEISQLPGEPEVPETTEPKEDPVGLPASTSPFYLEGRQLTGLVYENIGGVNYVTVESFLWAVNPEVMMEEEDGFVTASVAFVTEVVDVETEDADIESANVVEETLTLSAETGACYIVANGRYLYVEDGVMTVEGRVAVPIRVLAQMFNMDVGYDTATRQIVLTRREGEGAVIADGESYYDEETLYWLSRIIYSESGNQSMAGKIAVGNVVMNRLGHSLFPNTIKAVLFQKNQFSPAMSGSIYRKPNAESVIAAKLVMDGAVVLEDALFFNRVGMNTFASRNRTYVTTIGGHAFYA